MKFNIKEKIKDLKGFCIPCNHLYLLQVEEYKPIRYIKSWLKHPLPINIQKVRKLKWTSKAKWIFIASLVAIFFKILITTMVSGMNVILVTLLVLLAYFIWPLPWLLVGLFTKLPIEKLNRQLVIRLTRRDVNERKQNGLNVIGVTGSYGKTTTKYFIHSILKDKIPTYATPKSYNTLFGIAAPKFKFQFVTNTIEYLPKETKVFIVEMGAYIKGEIKELCDAFPPDIAVLTGIATVHLERFKNIKNIIAAKSELIDALPDNGVVFINTDNEFTPQIIKKYKNSRTLFTYGSSGSAKDANIYIRIEEVAKTGTKAKVKVKMVNKDKKQIEEEFSFTTNVNNPGMITNLGAAIGVAYYYSLSTQEVKNALNRIVMPESRMQVINSGQGVTIINNGYNSNPISFANSIKTLSLWEDSYKVFVTPGIYELGSKTYEIHKELGSLFKDSSINEIILIGPITDALKGLEAGLNEAKVGIKVKHYDNIVDVIPNLVKEGNIPATVLFENDVPDQYS